MASKSGGIVLLLVLGLVAIGLADDEGDGVDADGTGAADADGTDFDIGDDDICDGVVVLQSASGAAEVPSDETETASSVACDMGEGQGDDDAVRALQQALATCNGQDIPVDGIYGEQTREAVARVEEQSGVSIDGTFDAETRDAMQWPATSATGTTCVADVLSTFDGGS